VFALWFQAIVSLALLTTNTYDQLLSYVVFADWLFFGLTAGALLIVRARDAASAGSRADVAYAPGHPWTTGAFVVIAAGIVINSFFVYPTQSLIGTAILGAAAAAFFVTR
jgi:APA family basic amino acid/polyamine antiporter